jgi:hypothetical protein
MFREGHPGCSIPPPDLLSICRSCLFSEGVNLGSDDTMPGQGLGAAVTTVLDALYFRADVARVQGFLSRFGGSPSAMEAPR